MSSTRRASGSRRPGSCRSTAARPRRRPSPAARRCSGRPRAARSCHGEIRLRAERKAGQLLAKTQARRCASVFFRRRPRAPAAPRGASDTVSARPPWEESPGGMILVLAAKCSMCRANIRRTLAGSRGRKCSAPSFRSMVRTLAFRRN